MLAVVAYGLPGLLLMGGTGLERLLVSLDPTGTYG